VVHYSSIIVAFHSFLQLSGGTRTSKLSNADSSDRRSRNKCIDMQPITDRYAATDRYYAAEFTISSGLLGKFGHLSVHWHIKKFTALPGKKFAEVRQRTNTFTFSKSYSFSRVYFTGQLESLCCCNSETHAHFP
jgi:hypothetical protein